MTALRAYLDRVWAEALNAFAKATQAAPRRPRTGGPITSTPTIPPLTGAITVDVPVERAFRTFTDSFDPDPAHASEIEVRFSRLERLVDGQALRDGITSGGG